MKWIFQQTVESSESSSDSSGEEKLNISDEEFPLEESQLEGEGGEVDNQTGLITVESTSTTLTLTGTLADGTEASGDVSFEKLADRLLIKNITASPERNALGAVFIYCLSVLASAAQMDYLAADLPAGTALGFYDQMGFGPDPVHVIQGADDLGDEARPFIPTLPRIADPGAAFVQAKDAIKKKGWEHRDTTS